MIQSSHATLCALSRESNTEVCSVRSRLHELIVQCTPPNASFVLTMSSLQLTLMS